MQPSRNVTVNVTNRTILRSILWIVAAILLYHFFGRITHALILIFASFFLALALNPLVGWVNSRLGISGRARATAVSYLMIVIVFGAFLTLTIPPLISQTRDFIHDAPNIVQNFQSQNSSLARAAHRYKIDTQLSKAAKDVASHYSNFGNTAFSAGKRVFVGLVSLIAVLVMTFMMLVEGPNWLKIVWSNIPTKDRAHYQGIAHRMYRTVSGFVNGQVILAAVAGTCSLLALLVLSHVLGVTINAVALAGIVALFGLIPLFGNPISSSIVILVCVLNSVNLAVAMLIYFAIYYQIENMTLQPYIQSRMNELTPLLVFTAAIVGVGFAGFLGAIAAIPAAGCAKILLEDQLQRRGLGSSNVSATKVYTK